VTPSPEDLEKIIQKIIEAKLPQMSDKRGRSETIIDEKCPSCESQILCVYKDQAPYVNYMYIDSYAHICMNPECKEHPRYHEDNPSYSDIELNCFFCDREI